VAEAGGVLSSSNLSQDDTTSLLSEHHIISTARNNPVDIFAFIRENNGDPAFNVKFSYFDAFILLTAVVRILYRN
jgi:hypothetical protein